MFSHLSSSGRPRRRAAATPSLSALGGLTGLLATLTTALTVTLAACGGGTQQFEVFVPGRLFAFGDESSALAGGTGGTTSGSNYGINGVNNNATPDDATDDFVDCTLQPNWTQSLAALYGFVFAECNRGAVAEPKARNWAAPGARVAEVATQVDAQVAAGAFRDKDLATLWIGTNDVVEIYRQFDGSNQEALLAEVRARGVRAGQVVNRLIALGAKVVVSNIPDLAYSPFAKSEETAYPGGARPALLSRLSQEFNERLGITILLDGRFVALVQTDQRFLAMVRSPASFSLSNVTDVACTTPPPACTNSTLVTGATPTSHLWSGDLWLSWRGHFEVGTLAISRAQRNPF